MKKIITFFLCTLTVICISATAAAFTSVYPTSTVQYQPDKAFNGYTILGSFPGGDVIVIDMNGNLLHRWKAQDFGGVSKPMPNGELLVTSGIWRDGQQDKISVRIMDFKSKTLWEFRKWQQVPAIPGEPQENGKTWVSRAHHDIQCHGTPVYYAPGQAAKRDGKVLVLSHMNENIAKVNKMKLLSDVVYELDAAGKIIWQWTPSEHLDEFGFTPEMYKAMQSFPPVDNPAASRHTGEPKPGAGFDWWHQNTLAYVGPNKWFDEDPVKYAAFNPENLFFNSRETNILGIIDKKTGKIVWRVGPDYGPKSENAKIGQIIGAHGVHMIPKGLPGAGNILLFDNGGTAGYGAPNPMAPVSGFHNTKRYYSRVIEFNPITREIVWEYTAHKANPKLLIGHFDMRFFSPFVSYAQRLPNGNTMITEGNTARIFEVTPKLETVWEYVSPYVEVMPQPILYRSYRVPYDWIPQLKKPEEVAVTFKGNNKLQIPNDKGKLPDLGLEGKPGTAIKPNAKAGAASVGKAPDDDDDEQPQGMHNY